MALAICGVSTFLALQAQAANYEVTTVPDGGTIAGQVHLGSARPRNASYLINKNNAACGEGMVTRSVIRGNGEALLDAVVYLEGVTRGKRFSAASKKIVIDQKNCRFEPALSVMRNGGELEAINSDPVLHNIHIYELVGLTRRNVFNVSQPRRGNIVSSRIELRQGNVMKVECDAHHFMHAYVFVARNPYFAVVDDHGRFEITAVPPGHYLLKVWHSVLGVLERPLEVQPNGRSTVDFAF